MEEIDNPLEKEKSSEIIENIIQEQKGENIEQYNNNQTNEKKEEVQNELNQEINIQKLNENFDNIQLQQKINSDEYINNLNLNVFKEEEINEQNYEINSLDIDRINKEKKSILLDDDFKNDYNIQDNYIINENENNLLIEEDKNNIKQDKNNIIIEEIKNDVKKEDINKNFIIEEKEEYDINSKEYIKLKSVLLNSFTLEKIIDKKQEKQEKQEKKEKESHNDFIVVDKSEQECNEMANNELKKGKCTEINKYKAELNLKKKLKKFHLFNHKCDNPSDNRIIYKLGKVLVFTYRKNFPKITNYKTKKKYTTDAWWGCMVRCGQMILSHGIYRLLKSRGINTKSSIYFTSALFDNYPIQKKNLHPFFQGMITRYNNLSNFEEKKDEQIKEFFPPFSIKTLCDVGELFERTAGEWFSDVIISAVFKRISEFFYLFKHPNLTARIMNYQSCIEIPDILEKCFVKKKLDKKNKNYIRFNKNYYYFEKMGIVFVNVRVGLDKIPKEYFKGIKELFNLKECIGIIGGKTRLAYYFIGYNEDDDTLLYLDPHVTKEADKKFLFKNILEKNINKEIHLLKMSKMSTAFTVGFCFRTYEEFLNLYEFWLLAKQKELPILGMVKQNLVLDEKYQEKEEDFSPTYIDKDEDDF